MNKVDLFKKVLEGMPKTFTSHDFYRECRISGISESYLSSGAATVFLKRNCKADHTFKKTYHKKVSDIINGSFSKTYDSPVQEMKKETMISESSCIEFLKSKGYKIFKYSEV